jgi:hypothetical protein
VGLAHSIDCRSSWEMLLGLWDMATELFRLFNGRGQYVFEMKMLHCPLLTIFSVEGLENCRGRRSKELVEQTQNADQMLGRRQNVEREVKNVEEEAENIA